MMRLLKEEDPRFRPYFSPASTESEEEGTREIRPLYPFVISGGANTERFYFKHLSELTPYRFNVRPQYFGQESSYTEIFPKLIHEIRRDNAGAKIFCVFDWDTIYEDPKRQLKHESFLKSIKKLTDAGEVVLCPSMPCVEYWFLLHFVDDTRLYKNYSRVTSVLAPYMKPSFAHPEMKFRHLMKKEKHLKHPGWVECLCGEGKLATAVRRAEQNILKAIASDTLDAQSYSFIYKMFK